MLKTILTDLILSAYVSSCLLYLLLMHIRDGQTIQAYYSTDCVCILRLPQQPLASESRARGPCASLVSTLARMSLLYTLCKQKWRLVKVGVVPFLG